MDKVALLEYLGAGLLVSALVISLFSFKKSLRSHSLRLSAILLVITLCLFSNHVSTYFAALFIVGTVVTELEFLQTLAAILRGNKHYFDYAKETIRDSEVENKISKEVKQDISANKKNENFDRSQVSKPIADHRILTKKVYEAEKKALDIVQNRHSSKIERNVRIRKGSISTEFDGIAKGDNSDVVFDVKALTNSGSMKHLSNRVRSSFSTFLEYKHLTGREAEFHQVIVVGNQDLLEKYSIEEIRKRVYEKSGASQVAVLTLEELGLSKDYFAENKI